MYGNYFKDVPDLQEKSQIEEVEAALELARQKATKLPAKLKKKVWDTIGELLVDLSE